MKKPPYYRPPGEVVYAIRKGREPGGPIKIGFSEKINRRYRELQDKSKILLKFLCVMPGDMKLERAFHWAFRDWALGHEWFKAPNPDHQLMFDQFWDRMHCDEEFRLAIITAAQRGELSPSQVVLLA